MKSYDELKNIFNQKDTTNIRVYEVNLPEGKDPESVDITWYFDADVSCLRLDDGKYYAISTGQGDPQFTQEILPPQS